jgi:hypothetical protein
MASCDQVRWSCVKSGDQVKEVMTGHLNYVIGGQGQGKGLKTSPPTLPTAANDTDKNQEISQHFAAIQ